MTGTGGSGTGGASGGATTSSDAPERPPGNGFGCGGLALWGVAALIYGNTRFAPGPEPGLVADLIIAALALAAFVVLGVHVRRTGFRGLRRAAQACRIAGGLLFILGAAATSQVGLANPYDARLAVVLYASIAGAPLLVLGVILGAFARRRA